MKSICVLILCLKETLGLFFMPGAGCGLTKEIKVKSRIRTEDTLDTLQDCSLVKDNAVQAELISNMPAGGKITLF